LSRVAALELEADDSRHKEQEGQVGHRREKGERHQEGSYEGNDHSQWLQDHKRAGDQRKSRQRSRAQRPPRGETWSG
jgi:hypothetical protein